eukprot:TRINITY_DN45131_c0_g1_i1.p1 TRINITY_DN45131_c0_g1~~TRINITY_DN45131_c0_g1_i1.p1  ORF type:complete len:534 (+),score=151.37 TRINITY_DN45131_c0_g1_i1:136-1737(+)
MSFDLLGLDFPTPAASSTQAAAPQPAVAQQQQATQGASPNRSLFDDAVAYPCIIDAAKAPAQAHAHKEASASSSAKEAEEVSRGADAEKNFIVRCEGRWRVRSAPSLNSKVIGTVANGTVVLGQEEHGTVTRSFNFGAEPGNFDSSGGLTESKVTMLWVRVLQFQAKEPCGVSEIKRDTASGGAMYCLRRNALGYGLYEEKTEPIEGPLLMLSEVLAAELRYDAQVAAADKAEDCSLTNKILQATESFSRFMSQQFADADEGGLNEDIAVPTRRKIDDIFEVKQKDQLKKGAQQLRKMAQKLVEKSKGGNASESLDVTTWLPKETRRRFSRLRFSLKTAVANMRQVVVSSFPSATEPKQDASEDEKEDAAASTPSQAAKNGDLADGSVADIERFADYCGRVERSGGWAELTTEIRQEIITFNSKFGRELEDYARTVTKYFPIGGTADDFTPTVISPPQTPTNTPASGFDGGSLLGDLFSEPAATKQSAAPPRTGGYAATSPTASPPAAKGGTFMPLLAPPPPPSCRVGASKLV